MKQYRLLFLLFILIGMIICQSAVAEDRTAKEKGPGYIGAMRVVKVNEWVSLREGPRKTEKRIMQVPLGAIVYNCTEDKKHFVKCEYNGVEGYILKQYLEPAPEYEPADTTATTVMMSIDEITSQGDIVLNWRDYNVSVLASHEIVTEKKKSTEVLRLGCFIDDEPNWGHVETAEIKGKYDMLKAFIAGTAEDPQVILFDGEYGMSMIDMLTGRERWMLRKDDCPLGNAAVVAVSDSGIIYMAGTETPAPTAVSPEGKVLWQARLNDPDLYDPYEIKLNLDTIEIKYASGMEHAYYLVTLDYDGDVADFQRIEITGDET